MTDLYVMRHAKSAYPPGVPDIDRPLNSRGERNAQRAAQYFASVTLQTALVSPSARTRATFELLGCPIPPTIVDDLYHASAHAVAAVVAQYAAGPTLVLGHNPGLQDYVVRHAQGDEPAFVEVQRKFPTAAIAHLRAGVLLDFTIPR